MPARLHCATRQLLPHVRIVARANSEESVEPLYQAGADFGIGLYAVDNAQGLARRNRVLIGSAAVEVPGRHTGERVVDRG